MAKSSKRKYAEASQGPNAARVARVRAPAMAGAGAPRSRTSGEDSKLEVAHRDLVDRGNERRRAEVRFRVLPLRVADLMPGDGHRLFEPRVDEVFLFGPANEELPLAV